VTWYKRRIINSTEAGKTEDWEMM